MWVTSSTKAVLTPNFIALGNFDGIHRGHQQVLQPILNPTPFKGCSGKVSNYATVVTFNPHPREFFTGQSKKLLTPLTEKIQQLDSLGVEQLVLLPFDRELASLSPQQFVEDILVRQLRSSLISVGEDFRFGHKREGTSADLQAIAAQFGIEVNITSLQKCQNDDRDDQSVRISSSLIREALSEGKIPSANRMLGRNYSLTGTVVAGQKLGRTIGFPTANLQISPSKFLPKKGVYRVRVSTAQPITEDINLSNGFDFSTRGDILTNNQQLITETLGLMNLGCRPTVDGKTITVEVHLLDWSGDLYGQTIAVSLEKFLRPEQKFSSLDALKAQISADCKAVKG